MKRRVMNLNSIKRICMISAVLLAAVLMVFVCTAKKNKAYGNTEAEKTCISIRIQEGDTLWDIASEYYTPECGSMKDYIKEIKQTNSLKSDSIHAGNYLLIPYYVINQ